jgi:glycosyltransferase involved in cell wall biosynthesis
MPNPLVSVVIPTHNRSAFVIKAIDSVLNQTYKNIELIVVDDFSGDNTYKIISERFKQYPKVRIFRNEKNLGFVKTLNKGSALAKGKYIARLDDDDTWIDSRKIEKQVDFLEKNSYYVLIGGGVVKVDLQGKEVLRYLLPEDDSQIREIILSSNTFIHSSTLFLKDAFDKAGGYKEEFGFFADWELWLNMGKFGKMHNFPEFFVNYLDNEKNSSHDIQIRRRLAENIKMKRLYKDCYPYYKKAVFFSFLSYFYSFLPFRKLFSGSVFQFKKIFFGIK